MMIKMIFYAGQEDGYAPLHTHYICLDHKGTAGDLAKRFLMKLFKDVSNLYKLGAVGVSCDNIFPLLQEHAHYFKSVSSITLGPVEGSRFKELKGVEFK
jgi:hypothetical protein